MRLVACLRTHIWATLDLAGRSRRQLRLQAAYRRRPVDQGGSESDTDYIERALAREEDTWHDE